MKSARLLLLALVVAALAACASRGPQNAARAEASRPPVNYQPLDGPPNVPFDVDALVEPVPRDEPLARYGNHSPYEVFGKRYRVLSRSAGYVERGTASWYGTKFHGRLTSTREPYDMYQFSAAHKTLPLPSYARVTRLDTGKSVVVRINDRGPFVGDRVIDLSYAAAVKLGIHMTGTAPVEVRVLHAGDDATANMPKPPAPDRPQVVSSAGQSYLQVGAFSSRGNAFAMRRRLQAAGFDSVRVYSARSAHGKVYRVRIGPLLSSAQAQSLRARLRDRGFGEANLLQR